MPRQRRLLCCQTAAQAPVPTIPAAPVRALPCAEVRLGLAVLDIHGPCAGRQQANPNLRTTPITLSRSNHQEHQEHQCSWYQNHADAYSDCSRQKQPPQAPGDEQPLVRVYGVEPAALPRDQTARLPRPTAPHRNELTPPSLFERTSQAVQLQHKHSQRGGSRGASSIKNDDQTRSNHTSPPNEGRACNMLQHVLQQHVHVYIYPIPVSHHLSGTTSPHTQQHTRYACERK